MTFCGDPKTMNGNAMPTPTSFRNLQKDSHQNNGHFSDLDQKKSGCSTYTDRPQGEWDRVAELMMINFGESGHPVFRATSPFSREMLISKGGGTDGDTIETFSHNHF